LFKNAGWEVVDRLIRELKTVSEKHEKTEEQQKYLNKLVYAWEYDIWEDSLRFALQIPFLMHICRLLCYDKIPNSGSEHLAATSYLLRVFCHALWLGSQDQTKFLHVINNVGEPSKALIPLSFFLSDKDETHPMVDLVTGDESSIAKTLVDLARNDDQSSIHQRQENKKEAKKPCIRTIKVCIHKVWADDTKERNAVNIPSLKWNCTAVNDVKEYAEGIAKTAENTWLKSKMASRAKDHNIDDVL